MTSEHSTPKETTYEIIPVESDDGVNFTKVPDKAVNITVQDTDVARMDDPDLEYLHPIDHRSTLGTFPSGAQEGLGFARVAAIRARFGAGCTKSDIKVWAELQGLNFERLNWTDVFTLMRNEQDNPNGLDEKHQDSGQSDAQKLHGIHEQLAIEDKRGVIPGMLLNLIESSRGLGNTGFDASTNTVKKFMPLLIEHDLVKEQNGAYVIIAPGRAYHEFLSSPF